MTEKSVHVQARIPESLRKEFQDIAKSNAQNPSALIRLWIEKYIKENK
ncbi:antitoxin component of RelBE/YafQ-DinJ toxin-antitoxin module [Virgibacillus natechei]|uniref:Antitoxin component of RelBE/YafQ-DinJ toxin-antitoxin module n=1 Tax=Virgibacillus natechei TaxID=1216297 RepID=A0ABS4IMB3_9BACI|nr:hypothetical protein [Virgibacillus natechei]MBP1971561.1 antitoxin component of RelBE/YafQ-DinJ toxin-antitoxin module [Virgibacillus natechei]UZD13103.1 hypothetical protein OLD84_00560 [Virgibacillus natechei]